MNISAPGIVLVTSRRGQISLPLHLYAVCCHQQKIKTFAVVEFVILKPEFSDVAVISLNIFVVIFFELHCDGFLTDMLQ